MKIKLNIFILLVLCLVAILLSLIIPASNTQDPLIPSKKAMIQINLIMLVCFNYVGNNNGEFPNNLDSISHKILPRELLYIENPESKAKEKWLYFKPEKLRKGEKLMFLALPFAFKEGKKQVRFVGYTDQSVEKINEKEFLKLLESLNNKSSRNDKKKRSIDK